MAEGDVPENTSLILISYIVFFHLFLVELLVLARALCRQLGCAIQAFFIKSD